MSTNKPRVSVVLPVYNAVRYVEQAVTSVLNQTFTDFEVIAINDGSTDGSLGVLQRLAAMDPRIRLISRENRGLVTTLNEGLAHAQGEYLARMDADDISHPERFARQVAYLDAHPECIALGTWAIAIDEDGEQLSLIEKPLVHHEIDRLAIQGGCPMLHPTLMMRLDVLRKIGGYRNYQYGEDRDLYLRLAEVGTLMNLADTLLQYRIHIVSFSYNYITNVAEQAIYDLMQDAYMRRGLGTFQRPNLSRGLHISRPSQFHYGFSLKAFYKAHNPRTARKHAWKAIQYNPFHLPSWRLLIRTYLPDQTVHLLKRLLLRESPSAR